MSDWSKWYGWLHGSDRIEYSGCRQAAEAASSRIKELKARAEKTEARVAELTAINQQYTEEAERARVFRNDFYYRTTEAEARVTELEAARDSLERVVVKYAKGLESSQARAAALEAKIDRLMWEYCPDEMTDEQKANWARHQVPMEVSDEE